MYAPFLSPFYLAFLPFFDRPFCGLFRFHRRPFGNGNRLPNVAGSAALCPCVRQSGAATASCRCAVLAPVVSGAEGRNRTHLFLGDGHKKPSVFSFLFFPFFFGNCLVAPTGAGGERAHGAFPKNGAVRARATPAPCGGPIMVARNIPRPRDRPRKAGVARSPGSCSTFAA